MLSLGGVRACQDPGLRERRNGPKLCLQLEGIVNYLLEDFHVSFSDVFQTLAQARTKGAKRQRVRQMLDEQKGQDISRDQETAIAHLGNRILPSRNIVTDTMRQTTNSQEFQEQIGPFGATIGTEISPQDIIDITSRPIGTLLRKEHPGGGTQPSHQDVLNHVVELPPLGMGIKFKRRRNSGQNRWNRGVKIGTVGCDWIRQGGNMTKASQMPNHRPNAFVPAHKVRRTIQNGNMGSGR